MRPKLEPALDSAILDKYFWAVCASGAISLLLAGCHPAPLLTPQQAEGKHLYEVRCAHCHEDNDLALKKVPPNLRGLFRHAALPSGNETTDSEVKKAVLKGRGLMPGFDGRFSEPEMTDLLAYLHSGMQ